MLKPVTARPAAEYPMRAALETSEPPGGTGVSASDELESEDKSATTEIVNTDVEALEELMSEDQITKPVTARFAAGHPMSAARKTGETQGVPGV